MKNQLVEFDSIAEFWRHYVPTYKAKSFRPLMVRFPYNGLERIAQRIQGISDRRSSNRIANYVDPGEMSRVRLRIHGPEFDGGERSLIRPSSKRLLLSETRQEERSRNRKNKNVRDVSIRFGVAKPGHGYGKERGDFCLVAAVYSGRTLTLFYRSIELIGGFAFDVVLIDHICKELEIEPKWIEIWASKAFIFALKGNSNEKLYPKLRKIFRVSSGPKAAPLTFDGNFDG